MQKNQLLALAVLFFISGVFGTSPVIEQHQVYATTPSPTPVTSSSIGALSGLQNAIANTMNNGCSLPCILGFRPEQTELFEILAFLEIDPNGAMAGEYTLDYAFSDPTISSDNYLISIQFHMYENIFNSATVYIEHPHDWLPAKTYRLQDAIASIQTTPEVYRHQREFGFIFHCASL